MQVIATALGFYGRLIQPDDIFEVPDDEKKSSWFVPTEPAAKARPTKPTKDAKPSGDDPLA